jgi:2-polyprenyl-3-methyl-5-hydroxy-6-metoxy-1,4-benzoquinol methylase
MSKNYQYNYSDLKSSVFDSNDRINKAKKTISVLVDYLSHTSDLILLDIGSSTGIMTNEYATYFREVVGIDIDSKAVKYANDNFKKKNISFINLPIEETDFKSASFDVITCSHIYEHVPSDHVLMENIYKLLKPGGICYFAAGNKYKIIETHYNLPFLSYFPKKIANFYIRIFTNHKEYYENLKSLGQLKKLVYRFEIIDYTLKILQKPSKFSANDMIRENTLKYLLVNFLSRIGYFIIPTYVWILKKP